MRLIGSRAHVAQSAEHVLGKDEVTGSIPVVGSSTGAGRFEYLVFKVRGRLDPD